MKRLTSLILCTVMLIRTLGKESEALSKGGKHPFYHTNITSLKTVGLSTVCEILNCFLSLRCDRMIKNIQE